jgi:hypothetical protein
VLLVLKRLAGEEPRRRFVVLLALALAAQFLISNELYLTLVMVSILFGLCAYWLYGSDGRRRLLATGRDSAFALVLSLCLVSPYLWHAFVVSGLASAPHRSTGLEGADILNFFVPTRQIWLQFPGGAEIVHRFTANGAERGAYLGLPLLVAFGLFAFASRRLRERRAVLIGLGLLVLASLGSTIRFGGEGIVPGLWELFAHLPISGSALPGRLTLFVTLAVALCLAVWLAEAGSHGRSVRWLLVLAGVLFVFPNPSSARWRSEVPNPVFFKTTAYQRYLKPGDVVLVLPLSGAGWSDLWQAEDGFRYRLVGGHFMGDVTLREKPWKTVYYALGPKPPLRSPRPILWRFLRAHGVREIVVAPGVKAHVLGMIGSLGLTPQASGGVLVYRLPGG